MADAIKSEVAKKITDALEEALSPEKKTAIQPPPAGSVVPEKASRCCRS